MSAPLTYSELERAFDGRIPAHLLGLADGRAARAARLVGQCETAVRAARSTARRAVQGLRDTVAGAFGIATLTADARFDREARATIELRRAWRAYRHAQANLRAVRGEL
jgi:hypothetical protein